MNVEKRFWYVILCVVLAIVGLTAGLTLRTKAAKPQSPSQGFVPVLKRSAAITGQGEQLITIRVNGFQTRDLLNLRPGNSGQITVAAGTLLARGRASAGCPACVLTEMLKPGPPLPDSSLTVTADNITFNRPSSGGDVVILDVHLPAAVQVQVVVNGELVLKSSIPQPLAYRDHQWGEGRPNGAGAMMMAALPGKQSGSLQQPVYDHNSGSYAVSSSSLRVLESPAFKDGSGRSFTVVLHIDESGQVIKVVPLTDMPPAGLVETLSRWRFEPFLIGGKPVRVNTLIHIK
ncbi:MAG TPA: hypothetical protein VNQ79_24995 [Blastocatellia bacterium]|nr:hypothetical protein [Blastocatellia bacterium]